MESNFILYAHEMEKPAQKNVAAAIKAGNTDVLLEWIDMNKARLYKIAWAYLKNHPDVEDALHNTIIKVMKSAGSLKNEAAFGSWFTAILLNECRGILRSSKRTLPYENVCSDVVLHNREDEETRYDLIKALKSMDKGYRELILLKYCSGYTQNEIAEIYDLPVGTVKNRIFRGLRMLRDILDNQRQ